MGLIAMNVKRWPKGIVPYTIDPNAFALLGIRKNGQNDLAFTIIEFITKTGIQLIPRTFQRHYVAIVPSIRTNCHSEAIGRKGRKQELRIGVAGGKKLCLLHEFCHVLGLKHEHQRFDRETYIKVDMDKAGDLGRKGDYKKLSVPTYLPYGKYDTRSIMHYREPSKVFRKRAITLTATFGNSRLSAGDVATLKFMYRRK